MSKLGANKMGQEFVDEFVWNFFMSYSHVVVNLVANIYEMSESLRSNTKSCCLAIFILFCVGEGESEGRIDGSG
jgi:hypothetical protein